MNSTTSLLGCVRGPLAYAGRASDSERARAWRIGLTALLGFMLFASNSASAQELDIRNRSIERLDSTREVTALKADAFGDQLNLQNGSVVFDVVDIDILGNNDLPVQLRRRLVIEDKGSGSESRGSLGGRDFDVPYLSGMFSENTGWKVGPSRSDQRCSLTYDPDSEGGFSPHEYWHGYSLHIPGDSDGPLLVNAAASLPKPTGTAVYPWITKNFTRLSCLASIKNGYGGQGFLALTPDGKKYYFDWVITRNASQLRRGFAGGGISGTYRLARKVVMILATRVEDRFGNSVDYTYDGNGALTEITSSDGRQITLATSGNTTTATSDSGTWTYAETANSATVTRPDGSQWIYAWDGTLRTATYNDDVIRDDPDCLGGDDAPSGGIVYSVTHPSGMKGEFSIGVQRHPRFNVPKLCNVLQFVAGPSELLNYSWLTIPNYADTFTLSRKMVTGVGLAPTTWTYTYDVGGSFLDGFADKCAIDTDPTDRRCPLYMATEVVGPGKFERYRFGSRYNVNEGQLLKKETGSDVDHILSTEDYGYLDPDVAGEQNFPNRVGENSLGYSDDLNTARLRPQSSKIIRQDGSAFSWVVDNTCSGKYCFDVFARPTKIVRSRTAAEDVPTTDPPVTAPTLTLPAQSTTGSYTASWTAVPGATAYQLDESSNGGSTWMQIQNAAAISRAVSGKTAGTYSYRVTACNTAGCGPLSTVKSVTEIDPPATAPALTVPAQNTDGSYIISWTAVTGATTYQLDETSDGGSTWTQVHNAAATSKAFTGKAADTYGYRVKACNAAGCGPLSTVKSVTEIDPPATAPALTLPAQSTTGSYTVSWTAVPGTTSYQLDESSNGGSTWTQVHNAAATSKAFTGKAADTYGYRVKACNAAGCGPLSTVKSVTEIDPPATAPALTLPAQSTTGSYTVSWTAVPGATAYQLDESSNGGSTWTQAHNAAATSKAFAGKTAGTYSYRVKACNTAGCGPLSTVKSVTEIDPPATAPALTVPAQNTDGSYTVSWTAVTGAATYQLDEISDGGSTWTQVHNAAATSKAFTGKAADTYGYRVKACSAAGCGPLSTVKSVTEIDPPATAPALTLPTQTTTGDYTVSWTAVSGAATYLLGESEDGGSIWSPAQNSAATSKAFTGKPAGTYTYRVAGCNPAGCGPNSTVKSITRPPPGGTLPAHPAQLNATQNGFMCDIAWTASSGATSYELKLGIFTLYNGPDTSISVDGSCSSPLKVRACNAAGCSAYWP